MYNSKWASVPNEENAKGKVLNIYFIHALGPCLHTSFPEHLVSHDSKCRRHRGIPWPPPPLQEYKCTAGPDSGLHWEKNNNPWYLKSNPPLQACPLTRPTEWPVTENADAGHRIDALSFKPRMSLELGTLGSPLSSLGGTGGSFKQSDHPSPFECPSDRPPCEWVRPLGRATSYRLESASPGV